MTLSRRTLFYLIAALWILVLIIGLGVSYISNNAPRNSAPRNSAPSGSQPPTRQPTALPTHALIPTSTITFTPSPQGPTRGLITNQPSTPTLTPSPYPVLPTLDGVPTPAVIGLTVQGRSLEVYTFGVGPVERMMIFGIHGGYEVNTIHLADELLTHLAAHPELIPANVTLYILRAFNPDGAAFPKTYEGRANGNGVDLNRNFSIDWDSEWPRSGCWDFSPISAGAYPFSEPESRALASFLLAHNISALISYHSAAPGLYPAGEPADPASVRLARAISAASGYPYPAVTLGCRMTGTLVDYAAYAGSPALDLELATHWDTEFETNLIVLDTLLKWRDR